MPKQQKQKREPDDRPRLIDESDGPCPECETHSDGTCDKCGKQIPEYENMGGSGYQSPKPSHFHVRPVLGLQGRESRYAELCRECYRREWAATYQTKSPV